MIEYMLLICWLISIVMIMNKDSFVFNLCGTLMVCIFTSTMYLDYSDVFGFYGFVLLGLVLAFIGIVQIARKVL